MSASTPYSAPASVPRSRAGRSRSRASIWSTLRGGELFGRVFGSESSEPDLDRVRRIGARFLGLGMVGYAIVSVPVISSAAMLTDPWWPPLSVLLVVGSGITLVIASFRAGTGWSPPLAMVTWLGYLLGIGLWFVAWRSVTVPDPEDSAQWMIAFSGMPSMVLMLVRARLGIFSLVVSSALAHVSQQFGRFGEVTLDLPFEILWAVAFTAVFLAVVGVATRTGHMLDETREDTYRTAANVAAASARAVETARFDAIVHDRVIASLLAVSPGNPDERLAAQARSALVELAAMSEPVEESAAAPGDAIRRIRSAVGDLAEDVDVEIMTEDGVDVPDGLDVAEYPVEVVDAIVEAMSEALRNVRRHAGTDAHCGVFVYLGADAASMAVIDNGSGFDPDAVPPGRVRIAASIRGRLARVPGGHADVMSRRGRGTTVTMRWERP